MWKPVPSAPGYEASSSGLVRGPKKRATRGVWDLTRQRYVMNCRCPSGRKKLKVARMVCEAFHGPAPEGKPYVLHDDEDSRNNRAGNVYWGTQKENLNAPGFIAYCRRRIGENSPVRKG